MAVDITFLGHSGFLIGSGGHHVAIDPFLTGNPVAVHKPADLKCGHIVLTHGHADHYGDTHAIAKANNATVIGAYEVTELATEQGIGKVEAMNPGGRIATPFGWVALTPAFHSSSYNGRYTGMPCGVVINIAGVTIYHTGDTALFSDMKLIGELYYPDVAMICAGDRFTMGPAHATRAAEFIGAKVAIPMHFGTWPMLADEKLIRERFNPSGSEVRILKPGDTTRYG